MHLAWDRALNQPPLSEQVAEPLGLVVKLTPNVVARLPRDVQANLSGDRGPSLAALQQVLDARGVPLAVPGLESLAEEEAEAAFQLADDTLLLARPDAYYAQRTSRDGGRKEWPVLARPLHVVKRLTVEGEPRMVMQDEAGTFAGTFGECFRRLRENGQALDPKQAERALARLRADAPSTGDAPATFGLIEHDGKLAVPTEFYPRPGHQSDAVRDLQPYLKVKMEPDGWRKWHDFFAFYHAREWMPLAGLAAMAPASLMLRAAGVVVPSAYSYSRDGETGKTTLSNALSAQAYGIEATTGEAVNSEFRFLGMLNAACLPRLVDEAERLDWKRYGAVLKAAMGAEHAGDRGNKDRTVESYRSRAVPFFTSNARPPLSSPVLTRFLMLSFDEERKSRNTVSTSQAFRAAVEALPAAGPALAAALVNLYPTRSALLERHKELSNAIGKGRARWDDTRRPGAWAVVFMGVEAWSKASTGVVEVPSMEAFLRDVVDPVELATFEEPVDALETLRGWLEGWAHKNPEDRPTALTGRTRLEVRDPTRLTGVRHLDARFVTRALLDIYNREMEKRPEVLFNGLGDVARAVARQYGCPREALVDASGNVRVNGMSDGSRGRAVPLPIEAPGLPPTPAEAQA